MENLYNIAENFNSMSGESNPFYGRKHSLSSKRKMSAWKKENFIGEQNPNYGKRWNESQRSRMRGSLNENAKLTEDDVVTIKQRLQRNHKHQDIASDFGVSRTVITRINSGARWGHVTLEN